MLKDTVLDDKAKPDMSHIEIRIVSSDRFEIDIGSIGTAVSYLELVHLRNELSKVIETVSKQRIEAAKERR